MGIKTQKESLTMIFYEKGAVFLAVDGTPVPQARPRFTTRGGYARAYETEACRQQKQLIKTCFVREFGEQEPTTGVAYHVSITVFLKIPKSITKKNRELANDGILKPTKRPDVDNYAKLVLDALNGVVWVDDGNVTSMSVDKKYSDRPRTEITITRL